jgi:hypothetical protein
MKVLLVPIPLSVIAVALILNSNALSDNCFKNTTSPCPATPPLCGDITCPKPAPTWVVNPNDDCELIPEFSYACPDNSKEPTAIRTTGVDFCDDSQEAMGYADIQYGAETVVCWKWRFCSHSCTETAETDGDIMTKRNPNGPSTCAFTARKIKLYKHKCNIGVSSGDASLGEETMQSHPCIGPLKPCAIDPA